MDLREAVRTEMEEESRPFVMQSNTPESRLPSFLGDHWRVFEDQFDGETRLLRDVGHTSLLLRALSWVDIASQDIRVRGYVREAVDSIHRPSMICNRLAALEARGDQAKDDLLSHLRVQAMATRCLAASFMSTELKQPYIPFLPEPGAGSYRLGGSHTTRIMKLRQSLGVQARYESPYGWEVATPDNFVRSELFESIRFQMPPTQATSFMPLICSIVLGQLRDTVAVLEAISGSETVSKQQRQVTAQDKITSCYLIEQVAEFWYLLAALSASWRIDSPNYSFLVDASHCILHSKCIKHIIDASRPQLHVAILKFVLQWKGFAKVDVGSSGAPGLCIHIFLNIDS